MEKRKKNTREDYLKKWEKLMETFNFIPQAGEEIVQCKEPYPAYWFVSNKGYVLSVWGQGLKFLSPLIHRTGSKNKNGQKAGREWNYNYLCEKKKTVVPVHRIIADHFLINEFTCDHSEEVHHVVKRSSFADDDWKKCNEAENLQKLPRKVHKELTQYSKKQPEQIEAEWDQLPADETIELSSDQTIALINTLLQQPGMESRVHLVWDNGKAAAAYPPGAIITHTDADGKVTRRIATKRELARLEGKDSSLTGEQKEPDSKETESEDQEEQKEV